MVTAKPVNHPLQDLDELPPPRINAPVILLTTCAAIGGLLFGYDTGIISGAILLLKDPSNFNIPDTSEGQFLLEIIVSGATAGAILGAAMSAALNRMFGRRFSILLSDVVFMVGSVLMAFSSSVPVLIAGRIIVGLGIGFASSTVPVYISECAPAHFRGRMITLFGVFTVSGQAMAYATAYGCFRMNPIQGWRYMLGLGAAPAAIQLAGMLYLPESPRWLVSKGGEDRLKQARDVLVFLRGDDTVQRELQMIKHSVAEANAVNEGGMMEKLGLIWSKREVRAALITGVMLQVFNQIVGINAIMYYSSIIFENLDPNSDGDSLRAEERSLLYSLAVAGCGMLASVSALWIVDRFGRRTLLLFSSCSCVVFLVSVAVLFDSASPYVVVVCVCFYVMGFQVGLGGIPWTINAEIYPSWARSLGAGIATFVNWIMVLSVSLSFLSLVELLGQQGVFALFGGCAGLSVIFVYLRVPETKGVSLEGMEDIFRDIADRGYYRASDGSEKSLWSSDEEAAVTTNLLHSTKDQ